MHHYGNCWPGRWSPEEEATLRDRSISYAELERLVPHRTRKSIETRCRTLSYLRTKEAYADRNQKDWTGAEVKKLVLAARMGLSDYQTLEALPGRNINQIRSKRYDLGIRRDRQITSVACPLADQVRKRAKFLGMSLVQLDRQAGSGSYFQKARPKKSLRYCVSAIQALGGRVTIEWDNPF